MPQDTITIPKITGPPPPIETFMDSIERNAILLREALLRHIDSLGESYVREKVREGPQYLFPEWVMFLFVLSVVILSAYFYIIRPARREKEKTRNKYRKEPVNRVVREIQYHHWRSKYNPYYNSLSSELKKRFAHRTRRFLEEKEFRFHAMVEEEYIAVTISAAAVQMTFGLKNYLMDYFPVIHIIRKEYVLNIDKETYYGHVSRNGIYISWSHFLEGYTDYSDAINVGLHEMAHAVSYDLYLGETDTQDYLFRQRLGLFQEEAVPVLQGLRQGTNPLLDEYGATNFDEFWAVCIETFFEKPVEFQQSMPGLYRSLCDLLNQNPLDPGKIIDRHLAGLGI